MTMIIINLLIISIYAIQFSIFRARQQRIFKYLSGLCLVVGSILQILELNTYGAVLQLAGIIIACLQYYIAYRHRNAGKVNG